MKERGFWATQSHKAIQDRFLDWAECYQELPSPRMSEEHKKKLMKIIRASYPFGERKYFPYKAWLKEVKAVENFLYGRKQSLKFENSNPFQGALDI